jgi:hypothetical protein
MIKRLKHSAARLYIFLDDFRRDPRALLLEQRGCAFASCAVTRGETGLAAYFTSHGSRVLLDAIL